MHRIGAVAFKDLKILLRDRASLFWVAAMPLVMAVLFGAIFGGDGAIKGVRVALVDLDLTTQSEAFSKRLSTKKGLSLVRMELSSAKRAVRKGKLSAYVMIKKGFGSVHGISPGNGRDIVIGIDPSRKAERGFIEGAVTEALFKGFSDLFGNPDAMRAQIHGSIEDLKKEPSKSVDGMMDAVTKQSLVTFLESTEKWLASVDPKDLRQGMNMQGPTILSISQAKGVEPTSSYEVTFPASTIWGVLGIVAAFAGLIARERTQGTLLRFRVAHLSWGRIASGKGLAAFLAYMAMSAAMLLLGKFVFSIRLLHPIRLVMALLASGLCVSGLVLLVAPLGRTEQAVSGASWGVMMPFAIFGGATIPLAMMPSWMKAVSNFSPLKWSVLAMEGAIWRGFSFVEMLIPCGILIVFGLVCALMGTALLSRQDLV